MKKCIEVDVINNIIKEKLEIDLEEYEYTCGEVFCEI